MSLGGSCLGVAVLPNQAKVLVMRNIIKSKEGMEMKVVDLPTWMQRVDSQARAGFAYAEKKMEAPLADGREPGKARKIVLTDRGLFVSELRGGEYLPLLHRELDETVRFRRLQVLQDPLSKTPTPGGFTLLDAHNRAAHFPLPPALAPLWTNYLAQHLTELGFFQQYQILARIGKGSTSQVYRVLRLADGQIFAAKAFLNSYLQAKPERRKSVMNEIALLRAMAHENILTMKGVFETNSALYVVTELMEGGTLIERLNTRKRFTLQETKNILKGLINALNYLSRFEIMHRDVKLDNIMFRNAGWDVVLVDFGLAAFSQDEPYLFYRCGTPGYIAPEIINMQGNAPIDVACDVFSAGVVLHVLLTNRFLFQGSDNQQIYRNNRELNFDLEGPPYDKLDPPALDLLKQMLTVDYEDRIAPDEILEHEFLEGEETSEGTEKVLLSPAATLGGEECYHF